MSEVINGHLMTTTEIKDRLLDVLKSCHYGASTRHLCNLIFERRYERYNVRPGDYRMKQVYSHLKTLSKHGKVVSDYPGHWKLNPSNVE